MNKIFYPKNYFEPYEDFEDEDEEEDECYYFCISCGNVQKEFNGGYCIKCHAEIQKDECC